MNLKKYILLAALPIAFSACQEDVLVENPIANANGVFTIRGTMDIGKSDSRAQILLNGNNTTEEAFHWNEGDKFTLFQNTDGNHDWSTLTWTTHEFEIAGSYDDANPTAFADFSTTDFPNELIQGNSFVAIYPNLNVTDNARNVVEMTLDQTLTDNSEASWVEYFKQNMFMMAEGSIQGSTTTTNASFKQLCGLIRITYKNDTNEDKHLKGIFLNSEWGYKRNYYINSIEDGQCVYDQENKTDRNARFGLTFTGEEGAVVPAGGTSDFYILFFPSAGTLLQEISVMDMNNELITTPRYVKNGLDYVNVDFQSGKCYWLNVTETGLGLMWEKNPRSVHVNNQEELEMALNMEPAIDEYGSSLISDIYFDGDITLSKALSINNPVRINMQGHTLKVADDCTISTDKNTSVQSTVIYATRLLSLYDGKIEGPSSSTKHETLICASDIRLDNVTIDTKKIPNAIKSESGYSYMWFNGQSSVVTPEKGIALDMTNIMSATVNIDIAGTIDGDVKLQTNEQITEKNYNDIEINFKSGSIDGNLSVIDTGDKLLEKIQVDSAVSISETSTGWEGVNKTDLLSTIKNELETNGRIETNVSSLTIDKDVTFELDGSMLGAFYFRVENLMGKGTITFKNTSNTKTNLTIGCNSYLSSDVKFVFDGEFTKDIDVTTDNLGLIESAGGTDNVYIRLSNDVVINRQYVISENLTCAPAKPEEGADIKQGQVTIDMNGYNLTTSNTLTDAAFWVRGGYFAISNYDRNGEASVSTFKSNGHAIQIGAPGSSEERIDVYVYQNIEMESKDGHCFYLNAESNSNSYRAVQAMSLADKNRSVNSTVVGYGTNYSDTDENVDLSLSSIHVESWSELENAVKVSCVSDLILTRPLVVSGTKSIDLNRKYLNFSEDFFTENSTAIAGIEGTGNLTILNGFIKGCKAGATGKYLIKFTDDGTENSLSMYGVLLDGNGVSHGVYLENSTFNLSIGSTDNAAYIHVGNGGYALDLRASSKPTQAFIGSDDDPYSTSLQGKVRFTYDAFDSTEWSGVKISKADVFGELEKEGTNADKITIDISDSAEIYDSSEVSSWPTKSEE